MRPRLIIDDSRFQMGLNGYLSISRREISEAINYKAYFIVKRAMRHTKKANKKEIRSFIRGPEGQLMIGKMFGLGRFKKDPPSSRADATKRIISARIRSVAYLAAGWGRARAMFGKEAKASRRIKGVTTRGGLRKYSEANVARPGIKPFATFANPAGHKDRVRKPGQRYTQDAAMRKFGDPIFQASIRAEMRSMKKYMEKRMGRAARRAGGGR